MVSTETWNGGPIEGAVEGGPSGDHRSLGEEVAFLNEMNEDNLLPIRYDLICRWTVGGETACASLFAAFFSFQTEDKHAACDRLSRFLASALLSLAMKKALQAENEVVLWPSWPCRSPWSKGLDKMGPQP